VGLMGIYCIVAAIWFVAQW